MSDALSDIARYEREDEIYGELLETIFSLLDSEKIPDDIESKVKNRIEKLKNQDKATWIKIFDDCRDLTKYQLLGKFKNHILNPLKNQVVLNIDYGYGFANISGEIANDIEEKIRTKGMRTFNGDKYSILIDSVVFEKSEIVWRGHSSEKTPYKNKNKNE